MSMSVTIEMPELEIPEPEAAALRNEALRQGKPLAELVKEVLLAKAREINGYTPKGAVA